MNEGEGKKKERKKEVKKGMEEGRKGRKKPSLYAGFCTSSRDVPLLIGTHPQKTKSRLGTVVNTYNPSYLGDRDREDWGSRPAQAKKKKISKTLSQQTS
jgi:hypothetical protein